MEQNIAFPLVNHKEGKEIRRRTLGDGQTGRSRISLKRKPGQLSGSQQQRGPATGAGQAPDISCWTNLFSNLDARDKMREEIRRIQTETGVTTVFVTHDQEEGHEYHKMRSC